MALPAIPAVGGLLKGTGVVAIGRSAIGGLRSQVPRLRSGFNSLSQNVQTALGFGAGVGAGTGGFAILDRLGIEDRRTQRIAMIGAALVAVVGLGQLLDIQLEV